jgi:hypothetical protein
MIETYALLAVFTVQILVISLLYPAWVADYFRLKLEPRYADQRFARFFPDWDRARTERFLARFRAANAVIALLGLVPLVILYNVMQNPDWDVWSVRRVIGIYFMVQHLPLMAVGASRLWAAKKASRLVPAEVKRTASLQRRRFFDFVPPFTLFLAVLAYVLCAALSLYFLQNPVPEISHPLRPLAFATWIYAVNACAGYWMLFGKKIGPLEIRAERIREAGLWIKAMLYVDVFVVAHFWLNLGLEVLGLDRWIPFTASIFMMTVILALSRCLTAAACAPEAAGNPRQGEALP